MKNNRNNSEHLAAGVAVDEPHFDEEATVLSARPVVPLEEVEREESRSGGIGRRWSVVAALVVALMLGAFAATLVYKLGGPNEVDTAGAIEEEKIFSPEAGVAAAALPEPIAAPSEEVKVTKVEAPTASPTSAAVPSRNQVTVAPRKVVTKPVRNESREDEIARELELRREERRAEKRENRRLRRAEREARRNDESRSDDLLRIREIFEGSPRP